MNPWHLLDMGPFFPSICSKVCQKGSIPGSVWHVRHKVSTTIKRDMIKGGKDMCFLVSMEHLCCKHGRNYRPMERFILNPTTKPGRMYYYRTGQYARPRQSDRCSRPYNPNSGTRRLGWFRLSLNSLKRQMPPYSLVSQLRKVRKYVQIQIQKALYISYALQVSKQISTNCGTVAISHNIFLSGFRFLSTFR